MGLISMGYCIQATPDTEYLQMHCTSSDLKILIPDKSFYIVCILYSCYGGNLLIEFTFYWKKQRNINLQK